MTLPLDHDITLIRVQIARHFDSVSIKHLLRLAAPPQENIGKRALFMTRAFVKVLSQGTLE